MNVRSFHLLPRDYMAKSRQALGMAIWYRSRDKRLADLLKTLHHFAVDAKYFAELLSGMSCISIRFKGQST